MISLFCLSLGLGGLALSHINKKMPVPIFEKNHWVAIVGDSSVTGAVSNSAMRADWKSILKTFAQALSQEGPKIGRAFYSETEMIEKPIWRLNLKALVSRTWDAEELSFAVLYARSLGYADDEILMAAEDGAKIEALKVQMRRVYEAGKGKLPPLVLVSFVANDFCDPSFLSLNNEQFLEAYRAEIRTSFKIIEKMQTSETKTKVLFLAPLDLKNILENKVLLSQIVPLEEDEVSCERLRKKDENEGLSKSFLKELLIGECMTLLDPVKQSQNSDRFKFLQSRQLGILKDEIRKFNVSNKDISIHYVEQVRKIPFQRGDLANDCFHPSESGHRRIAEWMKSLEKLRR